MTEPTVESSGAPMGATDPGPAGDNQADGEKPGLIGADPEGSSAGAEPGATDTPQRHLMAPQRDSNPRARKRKGPK